jgi:uncharacterized glyoxalase superfamily protein PhnB
MSKGRLDAVGIIVSDLPRAVAFYRSLGLPFPEGAENTPHGHAEAVLEGGFRVMLDSEDTIKQFDSTWTSPTGSPRTALAIRCESPEAVDELFGAALEAGAEPHREPWDAFWGQRYAQLRDPDGNSVDLYADQQPNGP